MRVQFVKYELTILVIVLIFITACTPEERINVKKGINDATANVVQNGKETYAGINDFFTNKTKQSEVKIKTAELISDAIISSNVKEIDLKKIEKFEEYQKMIDNINLVIKVINDKTDTPLKYLKKDVDSYDAFMMEVTRYSPLINEYDELIQASKQFNPENEKSADKVLTKTMGFSTALGLILGGTFYKLSYSVTGELFDAIGISKLATICPSCASAAMSATHWEIRNTLIKQTSQGIEKAIS